MNGERASGCETRSGVFGPSVDRDPDRDFVPTGIVAETGEKRSRQEDSTPAGVASLAGFRSAMEQRLPMEPFPLIGNLVLEDSGLSVAMDLDRDRALCQKGLSQTFLNQLAQAVLFDGLLFDLIREFQVPVFDGIQK